MYYLSQSLTIEDSKIHFTGDSGIEQQVMMDWEDTLMSGSASFITQNGGDILEIGFGMGISANYIQSHSISSHTVIENHPDIIPLALDWSSERPNTNVITGSWYEVLSSLDKYDGIFYDTYGDEDLYRFESSVTSLIRTNGLVCWWNTLNTSGSIFSFDDIEYQVFDINPPANSYYNSNQYFLPKKQF